MAKTYRLDHLVYGGDPCDYIPDKTGQVFCLRKGHKYDLGDVNPEDHSVCDGIFDNGYLRFRYVFNTLDEAKAGVEKLYNTYNEDGRGHIWDEMDFKAEEPIKDSEADYVFADVKKWRERDLNRAKGIADEIPKPVDEPVEDSKEHDGMERDE